MKVAEWWLWETSEEPNKTFLGKHNQTVEQLEFGLKEVLFACSWTYKYKEQWTHKWLNCAGTTEMKWISFTHVSYMFMLQWKLWQSLTRKLHMKTDSRLCQDQLLCRGFEKLITSGHMHTQTYQKAMHMNWHPSVHGPIVELNAGCVYLCGLPTERPRWVIPAVSLIQRVWPRAGSPSRFPAFV